MDTTGSDYHHGEMNVSEQAATYKMFGGLTKWASLALAVLLTLGVLWFCTGAGLMAGAISALVLLVLGVVFLRTPAAQDH